MNLTNYVKAGFPLLFVETFEIKRAVDNIFVEDAFTKVKWNFIEGVENTGEYKMPNELIDYILNLKDTLVIAENFSVFLDNIEIQQMLLNKMIFLKNKNVTLCMIGSESHFPSNLEKMITKIEFALPTITEFDEITKEIADQTSVDYNPDIAKTCAGLSMEEGENSIALSVVTDKELNTKTIMNMKRQMIKKTGFMDVIEPESIENVGGLSYFKKYIMKRIEAWTDATKPKIKSILLVGVPGTGKSLVAKAVASIFKWPLVVADIGAMKGGIVGETEKNTRIFTKTADAIGPCIILADEIEKAFSGATGAVLDSGVSKGQLGHFLTWSQERKSEAVFIATANDITALPPEFLRAGRWDVIFFVDFPNFEERKEIVKIMNKKYNSDLPQNDEFITELEDWTGAEIEQLAKDSLFDELEECIKNIPILKKTKAGEIKELQEFATRVRRANGVDKKKISLKKRIVKIDDDLDTSDLKRKIKRNILEN